MTIETARSFLLWCTIINYGVLVSWFALLAFAHDWLHRFHSRCFRLPVEQFDSLHYQLMGIYKLGILLFNLAPWIALHIVG